MSKLTLGTGDCSFYDSILTEEEEESIFYTLRDELEPYWGTMKHKGGTVPRKIIVEYEKPKECQFADMIPIYRHPVDTNPPNCEYTPIVLMLRDRIEDLLAYERGTLNHALIQFYQNGSAHISDHSDKTIDIKKGFPIIDLSIGATRTMKIRSKVKNESNQRDAERICLTNGSVLVMGLETNKQFHHGIGQDKRDSKNKSESELNFGGERISLTFRAIATYINPVNRKIYGQGAKKNTEVVTTEEEEQFAMLKAFSAENREHDFDWDLHYGSGFSCIDLSLIN